MRIHAIFVFLIGIIGNVNDVNLIPFSIHYSYLIYPTSGIYGLVILQAPASAEWQSDLV